MNDALLPARGPRRRLRRGAVAPEDRARRVARALALEPWPEPSDPRRRRPRRDRARRSTRTGTGAPATDELYRGPLELVDDARAVRPRRGARRRRPRRERRRSHVWPPGERRVAGGPGQLPLARRCRRSSSSEDGLRTPLPAACSRPGVGRSSRSTSPRRRRTGRHTLVLDLLHEHVRWFGCEPVGSRSTSARALRRDPRRGRAAPRRRSPRSRRARARRPPAASLRVDRADDRAWTAIRRRRMRGRTFLDGGGTGGARGGGRSRGPRRSW